MQGPKEKRGGIFSEELRCKRDTQGQFFRRELPGVVWKKCRVGEAVPTKASDFRAASCGSQLPPLSSCSPGGPLSHRAQPPPTALHLGTLAGLQTVYCHHRTSGWKLRSPSLPGSGERPLGPAPGTPDSCHLSVSL